MKFIMTTIIFSISLAVNASLVDGTYMGVNSKTQGECKIDITMDGDYLESRGSEYRVTVHTKGPFIDCKDYDNVEFAGCASGEHTNGDKERSIYIMLSENDEILKIYFQDSDTNSTNDRECTNFVMI